MTKFIIITVVAMLSLSLVSPPAIADWERIFTSDHMWDEGYSVQQTSDGGYIITGFTSTLSGETMEDLWLIKTDEDGNELWNRVFGAGGTQMGQSVRQTSDGGYIIAGYKNGNPAGIAYDFWLIKTDSNGIAQWDRTFTGEPLYGNDLGRCVRQTTDGGYIIVGMTDTTMIGSNVDVWLVKTDSSGNKQWDRTFGGSGGDVGTSVEQTSDGGYIIGATTESNGDGAEAWLIKTDSNGIQQWSRTFGSGPNARLSSTSQAQQTSDGGYVIAGGIESYETQADVWLIKTDSEGTMQWERRFGGPLGDRGDSVQQTGDGGYIIAGHTTSYGVGYRDLLLIKTDENGNQQWLQAIGGSIWEDGNSVQQTSDGGYIITGSTNTGQEFISALWLVKVEDAECSEYFVDWDGDGYGDSSDIRCVLTPFFPYSATIAGDCDDSDPEVNPGMNEVLCNGKDDDCDPETPDGPNADGDPVGLCEGDCDDNDPGRYPGNPEVMCNGIDEDCSGATPDDPNADGDPVSFCEGDCDDTEPANYPGNREICDDGIDNDCDGSVDTDDFECPCPALSDISCIYPGNGAIVYETPVFTWDTNAGTGCHSFAIDLSFSPTFARYWSTYENLHQPIKGGYWVMPQNLWNMVPVGRYVYWRVRGADIDHGPFTVTTGAEVRWFYKW